MPRKMAPSLPLLEKYRVRQTLSANAFPSIGLACTLDDTAPLVIGIEMSTSIRLLWLMLLMNNQMVVESIVTGHGSVPVTPDDQSD